MRDTSIAKSPTQIPKQDLMIRFSGNSISPKTNTKNHDYYDKGPTLECRQVLLPWNKI